MLKKILAFLPFPSLVVIAAFICYIILLIAFSIWVASRGLVNVADSVIILFASATLLISLIIFIFGPWAMVLAFKMMKASKKVLLWGIPVSLIFVFHMLFVIFLIISILNFKLKV